jgi:hypothetical protein
VTKRPIKTNLNFLSWNIPRWTENNQEILVIQSRWPVSKTKCEPGCRKNITKNCKPCRLTDPWFYCKLCSSCWVSFVPPRKTLIMTFTYDRDLRFLEAAACHSPDSTVARFHFLPLCPFYISSFYSYTLSLC